MNLGVIGYGYWGPNLVRNIICNKNLVLKAICDIRQDRADLLRQNFPDIFITLDYKEIIFDHTIDAIVIATPVGQHYEIAKYALESGKHILVEKPMTDNLVGAKELNSIADKKGLVLMTDHVFMYNGVVKKIKQLIDFKELGNIKYIDSTRINLGLFQNDINVIWDLATHDISILNYLVKEKPYSIISTGKCHTNNNIENIAYITLNYHSDLIVHIHCSWSSPVKVRQMLIGGDKKMLIYNDIEPTEKIKIYDCGFTISNDFDKHQVLIDYRIGDVFIPKYDTTESLVSVIEDFYNAVKNNTKPLADGNNAINVLKIIEAADESLKNKGREVIINWH